MSLNDTFWIVQQNINRYFCPICLTLGLIGCSFNILLFSQKQFRKISYCTYFLSASVLMFIVLIVGFFPHIVAAYKPDPTTTILLICRLRAYSCQSLTMMYRWLMTMACIDRYMVSSDNVYLRKFANPRIAYRIITKILIICIIFPIHNLIFPEISKGLCVFRDAGSWFYHSVFTFTLGALFPTLIMIVSLILIRSNLASKHACRQRSIRYKNERIRLLKARDQQVLLMLSIQILVYIFTIIPWMMFLLYAPYGERIKNKSINRIVIEKFSRYLAEMTIYLYPTLSFYVYTLTSRTFRSAFINLILTLIIGRGRSQHVPQPLLMQVELGEDQQIDQSNITDQSTSMEMKTLLDCPLETKN